MIFQNCHLSFVIDCVLHFVANTYTPIGFKLGKDRFAERKPIL